MSDAAGWMLMLAGQALMYRAGRHVCGNAAAAALAVGAMLLGQLITFPLSLVDAAIFAVAALAVERAIALAPTRTWAHALLAIPVLLPLIHGVHAPSLTKITDLFFCSQHGVAATSAVLWLGFAGSVLDRRLAATLIGIALTSAGALESTSTWQDAVRLIVPAMPIAGVGLAVFASVFAALARRRPGWAAAMLLTPLLVFNATLLIIAQRGGYRLDQPIPFATIGAAQARIQHDWIGHPLSFPATLIFSATTGFRPAQFDMLGVSHVDAAHPIVVDVGDLASDLSWLADGWHGPERAGDISYRWIQPHAAIFLPPLPAARITIKLLVRPVSTTWSAEQTVNVRLGDRDLGSEQLVDDWVWIERDVDLTDGGTRATLLTLNCSHSLQPTDPGRDSRVLAVAVERFEIRVH